MLVGVFGFISFNKKIEHLFHISFALGFPNVVDYFLGLWLRWFGLAIEYIHGFMMPEMLLVGRRIHFVQRGQHPM